MQQHRSTASYETWDDKKRGVKGRGVETGVVSGGEEHARGLAN